ncbi:MAG: glycerol-3-phosphate acyltransferase [Chloroflexota bacterium]
MDLTPLAWVAAAWLLGTIPFAVLVTRRVAGADPRAVADGNPGATNAFRAGGRAAGALATVLDIAKGTAPVAAAVALGAVPGWWLGAIIVAPVVGHCFTPWLRGRGGKGVATTYGVLLPVSLPAGPVVLPLLLIGAWKTVVPDGWAATIAAACAVGVVALSGAPVPAVVGAAVCAAIIAVRYRDLMAGGPRLRRRSAEPAADVSADLHTGAGSGSPDGPR